MLSYTRSYLYECTGLRGVKLNEYNWRQVVRLVVVRVVLEGKTTVRIVVDFAQAVLVAGVL